MEVLNIFCFSKGPEKQFFPKHFRKIQSRFLFVFVTIVRGLSPWTCFTRFSPRLFLKQLKMTCLWVIISLFGSYFSLYIIYFSSDSTKKWSFDLLDMPNISYLADQQVCKKHTNILPSQTTFMIIKTSQYKLLLYVLVRYSKDEATIERKCYRSIKKSEAPHSLFLFVLITKILMGSVCA
jgi:hypothetical protein